MFLASKATLARDLTNLVKVKLIVSVGTGPNTTCRSVRIHPLLAYIDLDQYFALAPDSQLAKLMLVLLVVLKARLYTPLPVM